MKYKTTRTTWADYLKNYKLVLFNEYPEIVRRLGAWDDIPAGVTEHEDGETREVFQWYHIAVSDWEAEAMAEETEGEVAPFYSEVIGGYILPVYHFGTPWNGVELIVKRKDYSEE